MKRPSLRKHIAGFTLLVAFVAAQTMARSRAGLGLTIFALLGAYALAVADKRSTSGVTPTKLIAGATALAVIFSAQFALYRIMERFGRDPLDDERRRSPVLCRGLSCVL